MRTRIRVLRSLICTFAVAGFALSAFGSGIELSLKPSSSAVNAGGSGFLDVLLTNSGSATPTLGGFSFGLTSLNTNLIFQSATTTTSLGTYVFANDSFDIQNGFALATTSFPGQSVTASDVATDSGVVLATSQTFDLGEISFTISPSAPSGSAEIDFFLFPTTSLSDNLGNNINIDQLNNASITIAGAVVPEPSTLVLTLAAAPLAFRSLRFRLKRRS